MSADIQAWIDERRSIHAKAEVGWEYDPEDGGSLWTNAGRFDLHASTDDLLAAEDAHNNLHRALSALQKALHRADQMEADARAYGNAGHYYACEALQAHAAALRGAIQEAISGE